MTWRYSITKGELTNGAVVFHGYSGNFGEACNNPDYCRVACVGPIPPGAWKIGEPFTSVRMGLCVLPLSPEPGTETFKRSGFFVHGDSIENPGHASDGCIILSHAAREALAQSADKSLEVVL